MVEDGRGSGISAGAVSFVDGVFRGEGRAKGSIAVVCVFQTLHAGARKKCERDGYPVVQRRTRESGKNGFRMEATTDSPDHQGKERRQGSGRTFESQPV